MENTNSAIASPLQKLRLKYYWQGVIMHDMVSIVGVSNVLYAANAIKRSPNPPSDNFYYVTRQSTTNGQLNYLSIPIKHNCTPQYFNKYLLDSRCIVISGDTHQFSAMLIPDSDTPVLLGRESYAVRLNTKEDAIMVHAWLLSKEVSSAIGSTFRERATMMNKHSIRMSIDDLKTIPVPSLDWLRNNYSHGSLKAKCVGLGDRIVTSLKGASVNDPIYGDMVGILENAISKIGCADSV